MPIRTSLMFVASADGYGKLPRQVHSMRTERVSKVSKCLIEQFVGLGMENTKFQAKARLHRNEVYC